MSLLVRPNISINDAKKITPNYLGNEFGGLKDRVLFELAKNEISKLPEPFFVSLTTLDTHISPNPYYDPECERKFNDFRDAVYCTGEIVGNFINWLKKQPYWDRTTIVIMGDHQAASRFLSKSEVYNVFINSKQTTNLNNRKFTTYDFAPTILEATG